eukprot:3660776-Prorocentrum_lima.AAC.1
MTSSLVGSEMCIRDRICTKLASTTMSCWLLHRGSQCEAEIGGGTLDPCPVSYTHLTLPTICSV